MSGIMRENKHQDWTISCLSLFFDNFLFMFWQSSRIITSQTTGSKQLWWTTHPVQTASACFPSLICCHLRGTNPLCSGLKKRRSREKGEDVGTVSQWETRKAQTLPSFLWQTDMIIKMLAVCMVVHPCIIFTSYFNRRISMFRWQSIKKLKGTYYYY